MVPKIGVNGTSVSITLPYMFLSSDLCIFSPPLSQHYRSQSFLKRQFWVPFQATTTCLGLISVDHGLLFNFPCVLKLLTSITLSAQPD